MVLSSRSDDYKWKDTTNGMQPTTEVTPVYVPYATLISALDTLKQHGIPRTGKIDKTIWDSQSGAVQAQLILGFRFLGLIDDQKGVSPQLPPLVAAAPEDRKGLLKKIIEDKYRSILALDLETISQGQLEEAFRKFDVSGSTLDRATRFFVKACADLGIPIAKRFSERARPIGPRKKRTSNAPRESGGIPLQDASSQPPPPAGTSKTVSLVSGGTLVLSATLDLFSLDPNDRKFLFELIDKLEGYEREHPASKAETSEPPAQ
jgi:hypothetical protein